MVMIGFRCTAGFALERNRTLEAVGSTPIGSTDLSSCFSRFYIFIRNGLPARIPALKGRNGLFARPETLFPYSISFRIPSRLPIHFGLAFLAWLCEVGHGVQ